MSPRLRRFRANCRYLQQPLLRFVPVLLGAALIVLAGGICFYAFYERLDRPLTFGEALYLTYCMIFMEHLYPYPQHPVLQFLYWALPVAGLAVVLDAVVRFSYHVVRRDENSQEWIRAMSRTYSKHVVLCGLGKVGVRVLAELLALGEDVGSIPALLAPLVEV